MSDKSQSENIGNNSKGLQGGRDAIDNSNNTVNVFCTDKQEKKDFGIIEDIFQFLFSEDIDEAAIVETSSGMGLKKISLNFSGDGWRTINEMVLKTTPKITLVKRFVNNQREIDESKIDGIILKIQRDFRNLKGSEGSYGKIEDVRIVEKMADNYVEASKINNPDYYMNALAIILYFFEMCDFGSSEEAEHS